MGIFLDLFGVSCYNKMVQHADIVAKRKEATCEGSNYTMSAYMSA